MTTYAKYDIKTGRILSVLSMPESDLDLYDDEFVECSEATNSGSHYVENEALVEKPPRPSAYHYFDYVTKQWVLPDDGIDQAKQEAIRKINAKTGEIITARLPLWKQNNLTARAVELQANQANWTTEDANEFAALQAEWGWVKAVRAASNAAVAAVQTAETVDNIQTLIEQFNPA